MNVPSRLLNRLSKVMSMRFISNACVLRTVALFVSVVVAVGCSKKGTEPDNPTVEHEGLFVPSSVPVGFSISDDWADFTNTQTRSDAADPSVTQFNLKDTITLFGYYLKDGALSSGAKIENTTPNFMYNQAVFKTANYNSEGDQVGEPFWDYTPTKYWPNNENDRISFYALYPYIPYYNYYVEPDVVISANTVEGPPQFTYKIPESLSGGRMDFLYATALNLSKPAAGEATKLQFNHLMGKIQFFVRVLPPDGSKLTVNTGAYSAYIKSISYLVNKEGTFKFTFNDGLPIWDIKEDSQREFVRPYSAPVTGIEFNKGDNGNVTVGDYGHEFTAFLLPVTINELNVNYSTDGINYSTSTISLTPDPINVIAGKVTTVTLVIKPGAVKPLTVTYTTMPWKEVVIEPSFSTTPN